MLSPNLLGRGDGEDTNAQGGFFASPSAYHLGEKKMSPPNLLGRGDGEDMNARGGFFASPLAYRLGKKETPSPQPFRARGWRRHERSRWLLC
jgi:hypothetical protein